MKGAPPEAVTESTVVPAGLDTTDGVAVTEVMEGVAVGPVAVKFWLEEGTVLTFRDDGEKIHPAKDGTTV